MLGLALLLLHYGEASSEAAKGAGCSVSREAAAAMVVTELPAGASPGAGVLRGMLACHRTAPGSGTGICYYLPGGMRLVQSFL